MKRLAALTLVFLGMSTSTWCADKSVSAPLLRVICADFSGASYFFDDKATQLDTMKNTAFAITMNVNEIQIIRADTKNNTAIDLSKDDAKISFVSTGIKPQTKFLFTASYPLDATIETFLVVTEDGVTGKMYYTITRGEGLIKKMAMMEGQCVFKK